MKTPKYCVLYPFYSAIRGSSRFICLFLLILVLTTISLRQIPRPIANLAYAASPPASANSATSFRLPNTNPKANRSRYSSDYLYFSEHELTRFGEFIWFFGGGTFSAPTGVGFHSNEDIGVHPGVVFNVFVTTHGIIRDPAGSTFSATPPPGYAERIPRIDLRYDRGVLQTTARNRGTWLSSEHSTYTYGLVINGNNGYVWRWQTGTPSTMSDSTQCRDTIHWGNQVYAIYCDGDLWLKGVLRGKLGIGAAGNIRLMDDIRYEDAIADSNWIPPLNSQNYLTLVSCAYEPTGLQQAPPTGILIANTVANGRDNGGQYPVTRQDLRDIVITAQVIATSSSFTFQQQNNVWEPYQGSSPDNRGFIYLRGNLIQYRRGYQHLSNHGGTGHFLDYRYDNRFARVQPPFSFMISEPDTSSLRWNP